jgi:hypothetical protein
MRLTFGSEGHTNNTRIWVDGQTPLFQGQPVRSAGGPVAPRFQQDHVFSHGGIEVLQRLRLVEGVNTAELDTVQIQYRLRNVSGRSHEVGIRIMIDTLIGSNDGVPFIVPGHAGLVDRTLVVQRDQMPEFIQALERPDFSNPGTVISMTLRGSDAVPPDRMVLSHWPGSDANWDYAVTDIGSDSAVGLYYNAKPLPPGHMRPVVVYYGLGGLSSTSSGNTRMSLIAPKVLQVGQEGTVVVLVREPTAGQQVTLSVQPPLMLAYGHPPTKDVRVGGPSDYCELAWRIQALDANVEAARVEARVEGTDCSETTHIAPVARR